MTPAEHYVEAEKWLARAEQAADEADAQRPGTAVTDETAARYATQVGALAAIARTHATLATVSAVVADAASRPPR